MDNLEFETIAIILLLFAVSLWIWYEIIRGAVSKAIANADSWNQHYLRINNRLLITMLVRQGMSLEDIKVIVEGTEDQFWSALMPKEPPTTPIYKS